MPAPVGASAGIPWSVLAVVGVLIAVFAVASSARTLITAVAVGMMLAVMLHVGTIALVGAGVFKWRTHTIAFGTGPTWLRTSIADIDVTFGAVFFAGGVGIDNPSLIRGWRGALGELSGCLVVLVAATVLLRDSATVAAVPRLWMAILAGALSPLSEAQTLIASAAAQLAAADGPALLGLVFLGNAAFNLLPVPVLNGGNAIMALLIDRNGPLAGMLFKCGLLILVLLVASWVVALAVFVGRALS
jgi:hypothetical protein